MTTAWRHVRVVQDYEGSPYRVECSILRNGPWEDSGEGSFSNPSAANEAALVCYDGASIFQIVGGGDEPTVQYVEGFNGTA